MIIATVARGAYPSPLNYSGFPKSVCVSLNEVVCHGIPNDKPLRDGDIVNIDVTLIVDGWHGDSSRMYYAGSVKRAAERLVEVTYEAMLRGIAQVRPGNFTGDIGAAIQEVMESYELTLDGKTYPSTCVCVCVCCNDAS
jgi:methionyl aminopeptidase